MALHMIRNSLKTPSIKSFHASFSTSHERMENTHHSVILRTIEESVAEEGAVKRRPPVFKEIKIESHVPMDISKVSGVPEEHIKGRRARIHKTTKNAMQSGTENVGVWELDFETRQRWENPLMGWTSSGDPLSNMKVHFNTMQDAIDFANKNGWQWFLEQAEPTKGQAKSYGSNFSWSKRSRVSTK